jgi:hypothetical protein
LYLYYKQIGSIENLSKLNKDVPLSIISEKLTSVAFLYTGIFLLNNFIEQNSFIKGVEFYNSGGDGLIQISVNEKN